MGCNCGGNFVDINKKDNRDKKDNRGKKDKKDNIDKKDNKRKKHEPNINLFKKIFG